MSSDTGGCPTFRRAEGVRGSLGAVDDVLSHEDRDGRDAVGGRRLRD